MTRPHEDVIRGGASDGTLRMSAERTALVESLGTMCPRCMVPWGERGCGHSLPTADKLWATVCQIAMEEAQKERRRNAQHALRYRREVAALVDERNRLREAGETLLGYWTPPPRGTREYDFWEPPDGKTTRRILDDFRAALAASSGDKTPEASGPDEQEGT